MVSLKIMLVEDAVTDIEACESQASMYMARNNVNIEFVKSETFGGAIFSYDDSLDGVIVDLKLGGDSAGGDKVIERIMRLNAMIPVCITTGTPANAGDIVNQEIPRFIKGEFEYSNIFDLFFKFHKSGISKIFSAKGTVESLLRSIYYDSIMPQKNAWFSYGEGDPEAAERGLLRYTINNMLHRLDENPDIYFREEFYIFPPNKDELKTGSVVLNDSKFYVVMTPACDLVPRANGIPKTTHIALVEVEPTDTYLQSVNSEKEKDKFKQNKMNLFLHYLPPASNFCGGFMNFRSIKTERATNLYSNLTDSCIIQISPFFVKDIVGRFSAFYARQGQPDINIK